MAAAAQLASLVAGEPAATMDEDHECGIDDTDRQVEVETLRGRL